MIELWLLATAIIFTGVGYYFNSKERQALYSINEDLTARVIEILQRDGFVKYYIDDKGETQILKWWEEKPAEEDEQ
jgi:hypothetical protein